MDLRYQDIALSAEFFGKKQMVVPAIIADEIVDDEIVEVDPSIDDEVDDKIVEVDPSIDDNVDGLVIPLNMKYDPALTRVKFGPYGEFIYMEDEDWGNPDLYIDLITKEIFIIPDPRAGYQYPDGYDEIAEDTARIESSGSDDIADEYDEIAEDTARIESSESN